MSWQTRNDQLAVQAGSGRASARQRETAEGLDISVYLSGRLPWLIGMVILLAFGLLATVFRSIAIPAGFGILAVYGQ